MPGGSSSVNLVDSNAPHISPAYFALNLTNVGFSAAQFYLLLSTSGLATKLPSDIQFAGPFYVSSLSSPPKLVNGYYIGQANGTKYISGPLPSGEAGGVYYVKIWEGDTSPVSVAVQRVIIQPSIQLSATSGPAGADVILRGYGFTPDGIVRITMQNSTSSPVKYYYSKNISSSSNGNFTWSSVNDSSFIIPDLGKLSNGNPVIQPEGFVYFTAYDWVTSTQTAVRSFSEQYRGFTSIMAYSPNVMGYVSPSGSPPYGNGAFITVYIGRYLNINGNYFNPSKPLAFYLNNTQLNPVFMKQVNGTGFFVADFTIPYEKPGIYQFKVSDATGNMTINLDVRAIAFPTIAITISYTVQGVGSGFSAPTLTYTAYGLQQTAQLTSSPKTYFMDPGSRWSITNPLTGSTSDEAWQTNQATAGLANANATINLNFYHQYLVTFAYGIWPSPMQLPPGGPLNPTITYISYGSTANTNVGKAVWVDAGTTFQFENPVPGASGSERYYAPMQSGIVNSPLTIQLTYFHQFLVTFQYTVSGGGSSYQPPTISCIYLNHNSSTVAGNSVWVDSGTLYTYLQILPGSSNEERWICKNQTQLAGTLDSAQSVFVVYTHQYYVTVINPLPQAGVVSPSSGWFDAGTLQLISASANPGWKFGQWTGNGQGSYTGPLPATSISILSPINETASFLASLTLHSSSAGSISYRYSGGEGTVPQGGQVIIYANPSSQVIVSAHPSSIFE